MKNISRSFPNFTSFLNYAETTAPTWAKLMSKNNEEDKTAPWSGTGNFTDAMTLARNGWPEGQQFLTTIKQDSVSLPNDMIITQSRSLDVVGCYPEIGLALSGDPECMVTIEPTPTPSPILRIGVAKFHQARIEPKTIMEYGGVIVSYIDALEAADWRCELTLCLDIELQKSPKLHVEIILKHAQDIVDKDRILFAIANPSMLRRLLFRVMETIPELEESYTTNYGTIGKDHTKDFDLFIPAVQHKATKLEMLDTISEILTKGIPNNDLSN